MDNSGVIPAELALASESRNPGINILLDARFREHDGEGEHRIILRISETPH